MAPRIIFPIDNAADYQGTVSFTAVFEPKDAIVQEAIDALGDAAIAIEGAVEGSSIRSFKGQQDDFRAPPPSKPLMRDVGTVVLYLPTNLSFNDGVEYGSVELGIGGAVVNNALATGGSGADAAKALGKDFVDQFLSSTDAIKSGLSGPASQIALQRLVGKVDAGIRGGLELATGITVNPNRRSILRGVAIRNFTFQFKLMPTSQKEANAIKSIIQFFRSELYPEEYEVGGVAYGYKFPNKFRINLNYKNQQVATRILPSYLTAVDTNYNPNSMSFHPDGSFPEIDLTLRFVEERPLKKQDIALNY